MASLFQATHHACWLQLGNRIKQWQYLLYFGSYTNTCKPCLVTCLPYPSRDFILIVRKFKVKGGESRSVGGTISFSVLPANCKCWCCCGLVPPWWSHQTLYWVHPCGQIVSSFCHVPYKLLWLHRFTFVWCAQQTPLIWVTFVQSSWLHHFTLAPISYTPFFINKNKSILGQSCLAQQAPLFSLFFAIASSNYFTPCPCPSLSFLK